MKFLNLLNSDPTVITLLCYGVEGVHYNLNDAGEIGVRDTQTLATACGSTASAT